MLLRAAEPSTNIVSEPARTNAPVVASQTAEGVILLHARDAQTHGTTIRYEPQPNKNTIGYWTKAEDWVSWQFEVRTPGVFSVEILQGCGTGRR